MQPSFSNKLLVTLQRIIPARFIGRLIYHLARCETVWLKNFLINGFSQLYKVDTTEAALPVPTGYRSFNDFFTRTLRTGARDLSPRPAQFLMPADGAIAQTGKAEEGKLFQAKGMTFSAADLLGNAELAHELADCHFATIYLAPYNYHRLHMPIAGTLEQMQFIPGLLYSVNARTTATVPNLYAVNERLVCQFNSPAGRFALVLVGAMNVASISTAWGGEVFPADNQAANTQTFTADNAPQLAQGDYMGHFNMGSTIVMLGPKDLLNWSENLQPGTTVRVGESMGAMGSQSVTADLQWSPTATLATLQLRAKLLNSARQFFIDRNVLEVETPSLCGHGVTDAYIDSIRATTDHNHYWLRTSPEYHMKRLLAAGSGDIFQIGKAYRAGESGQRHQPEFTMTEWYRCGFNLTDMINETCEFITQLSQHCSQPCRGVKIVHYRDAFRQTSGIDPQTASCDELRDYALSKDICDADFAHMLGEQRTAWLDFLCSQVVHPTFTGDALWVIDQYPAEQAMLAQLNQDDSSTADRFEIFYRGVELANGFRELTDTEEQAERFATDRRIRSETGRSDIEPDPLLLAALAAGLPDCSGVAVGLDRVLLVANAHADISATISFIPGQ